MALNTGKILMRRGQEVNFDPNKMMPGEWAVSLDSKFVRMCFSPGVCIRMATYEAFEADMEQIRGILAECQTVEEAVQRIYEDIKDVAVDVERIETAAANALKSEQNALNSANSASQSANTAVNKASEAAGSANIASTKAEQATEGANTATQKASEAAGSADNVRNMSEVSQSYAVGGTGTREGEDTDNAKYYNQQASDNADRAEAAADRASAVADVGFATTEKAGLVKPDGETIRVDPDGTIHADRGTTSYTDLDNKPKINDVVLEGNKTINDLGGLTAESTVSFSQSSERTNIEATDNVKGIFGKIKKWFADLKPHAFSNPTNNLLATVAGTPLDAVQGKVLNDALNYKCDLFNDGRILTGGIWGDSTSPNLSKLGISSSNTLVEVVDKLKVNGVSIIAIITNSNNSTFNNDLPAQTGGIITITMAESAARGYIEFTNFRTGDRYFKYTMNGTFGDWGKLVTETGLNNRIKNYAFSNYRVSVDANYGMEIIMGIFDSNGISNEIKNLGITLDDTLEVALSKIFINQRNAYIRLALNTNQSIFNKSLPNSGAGVLEIHKINVSRGYIRLFNISNGEEFTNIYLNNALGTWQKISKTNV